MASDLSAAIRERLEAHAWEDGFLRHADAVAAIQAVLDLHPPVPGLPGSGMRFCLTCWLPGSERMEPAPWPCNTVTRIAEKLGVSDTQLPTDTVSGGNPSPGGER